MLDFRGESLWSPCTRRINPYRRANLCPIQLSYAPFYSGDLVIHFVWSLCSRTIFNFECESRGFSKTQRLSQIALIYKDNICNAKTFVRWFRFCIHIRDKYTGQVFDCNNYSCSCPCIVIMCMCVCSGIGHNICVCERCSV